MCRVRVLSIVTPSTTPYNEKKTCAYFSTGIYDAIQDASSSPALQSTIRSRRSLSIKGRNSSTVFPALWPVEATEIDTTDGDPPPDEISAADVETYHQLVFETYNQLVLEARQMVIESDGDTTDVRNDHPHEGETTLLLPPAKAD